MAFPAVFNLTSLNGKNTNDNLGTSVSGAGDLNGDGIADLVITAPGASPNGFRVGQSYVIFGEKEGFAPSFNLSALNGINGFAINGINAYDNSGNSVSSAGDINADGIADIVIGAVGASPNGIQSAGQSYVIFGNKDGFAPSFNLSALNGVNGFAVNGIKAKSYSGNSVSNADVNGDNITDIIIGASGASPNGKQNAGQSYVIFGNKAGFAPSFNLSALNGINGFTNNGINAGDGFGNSVSGAGDINADGIADLVIAAPVVSPNRYISI